MPSYGSSDPVILYVEDDETSREIMEMLLTYRMGYSAITIFKDTTAFMDRLGQLKPKPTLFFLDIHVRPTGGFEILKQLRADEQYAGAVVVAVTASVMNEEVDALQTAGFDGVIAKPIDPDAFPGQVTALLEGGKVWHITS